MERSPGEAGLPDWAQAFLIKLAIALNKTVAYPRGHPALEAELSSLAHDLVMPLAGRPAIEGGVARDRLVLDQGETDPRHPLLTGLADRLHRHHISVLRIATGVDAGELAHFLSALAERADDGEPLGLVDAADRASWPHITFRALDVGDLGIAGEGTVATPAASMWRRLAAFALRIDPDTLVMVSSKDIAAAITANLSDPAYVAEVATRIAEVARALAAGGMGTDLARGLGDLFGHLDRHGARVIMQAVDRDGLRRMMVDTVAAVPADAIVPLVQSAADATEETVSHQMIRLLTKLAGQARDGGPAGELSDETLRGVAMQLVNDWTLDDPNPERYRSMLVDLARRQAGYRDNIRLADPATRIVCMGVETGTGGAIVEKATETLIAHGDFETLVEIVDAGAADSSVAGRIREQVLASDQLSDYLSSDGVSDRVMKRLVDWSDGSVATQLLDALAVADGRAARRRLMSTLITLGRAIASQVIDRLDHGEWYVQRNMLAILSEMDPPPEHFSPLHYLDHADPRVRREAMRIAVRVPSVRTTALKRSLADDNKQIVGAALSEAATDCPPALVMDILHLADSADTPAELRERAIRVAGQTGHPRAIRWLVDRVRPPRWKFRRKLAAHPDVPLLIATLASAQGGAEDPAVRSVMRAAAASRDEAVREAAAGSRRT